eukprot:1342473-Pleurochrysis_carterae.AAC.2
MSAMHLRLGGVQTYGEMRTRLSDGLPVDGTSTFLFERQNSGDVTLLDFHLTWALTALGLSFPEETSNKVELKNFLPSKMPWTKSPTGAMLRGVLPLFAAPSLTPRHLDGIFPSTHSSVPPTYVSQPR